MEYDLDTGLSRAELDAVSSFFFMVFTPNPMKDRVRIWIDSGSIKVSMKRQNFVNLCVSLMGIHIQDPLSRSLEEVGGFFLLDRQAGTLKHLQAQHEREFLGAKDAFMATRQEMSASENSIISANNLYDVNRKLTALDVRDKKPKRGGLRSFFRKH